MAISNYRRMPCGVHVMGRNGGQDEQRTPSFAKTEMKARTRGRWARRGHERRHRPLRALRLARCTTRHGEARTRSWGMCRAMIAVSSGSVVFVTADLSGAWRAAAASVSPTSQTAGGTAKRSGCAGREGGRTRHGGICAAALGGWRVRWLPRQGFALSRRSWAC